LVVALAIVINLHIHYVVFRVEGSGCTSWWLVLSSFSIHITLLSALIIALGVSQLLDISNLTLEASLTLFGRFSRSNLDFWLHFHKWSNLVILVIAIVSWMYHIFDFALLFILSIMVSWYYQLHRIWLLIMTWLLLKFNEILFENLLKIILRNSFISWFHIILHLFWTCSRYRIRCLNSIKFLLFLDNFPYNRHLFIQFLVMMIYNWILFIVILSFFQINITAFLSFMACRFGFLKD